MKRIKNVVEWQVFGICSAIGEKLGIASSSIRLWFIYVSFVTMGSPVLLYLILSFWKNIQKYTILKKRNPYKWF